MKKTVHALAFGALIMSMCASLHAEYRPYVDLGFGYSGLTSMPEGDDFGDLAGVVPAGTGTSTPDNYGGRVAAGLLWNTQETLSYGLEAAAAYYGVDKYANDAASVEMNYYGLEFLGVAQLNLDKLRLIAKAGVTDEQLHPTKSNINNSSFTDSQQILPEVGAGVAYAITPNLQLGLTFYHTFGSTVSFDNTGEACNLPSVNMSLLEFMYLL